MAWKISSHAVMLVRQETEKAAPDMIIQILYWALHVPPVCLTLVSCPARMRPLGRKRSGERSRIPWAYSPKVVRTNEIARSVIIT